MSKAVSESVLLLAKAKCTLSAFHHRGDLIPDVRHIDCTLALDVTSRLIAGVDMGADEHEVCIAVDNEVRAMAGEDELSTTLRIPDLGDNLLNGVTIESPWVCCRLFLFDSNPGRGGLLVSVER